MQIIEHLEKGPAKQKDLLEILGKKSGTATQWLRQLVDAHLISQGPQSSTHDPYFLVAPDLTGDLLDVAAALAAEVSAVHATQATDQAATDAERLTGRRVQRNPGQPPARGN